MPTGPGASVPHEAVHIAALGPKVRMMAVALPEDDACGHEFEVPVLLPDALPSGLPVPKAAKQRPEHSVSGASLSSESVSLLDSNKEECKVIS